MRSYLYKKHTTLTGDFMDLVQMKARVAEIMAKLKTFENLDNFSQETVDEINALNEEFKSLKMNIEAKEKLEAMASSASMSTRKTGPDSVAPKTEVTASQKDKNGGFSSFGEFLMSSKNAAHGKIDKRFENTMFEKNGEDGGYLVPETFLEDVTKKMKTDESLLAKTRQFSVAGNALSLPLDEKSPWNGGVTATWMEEGGQYTEQKPVFSRANWRLHKLGCILKITDELLEDTTALESYVRALAPEAIMHKVNSAILVGDGNGKPQGILNSGFKVKIAKESGQAADSIVARNIVKMYSAMIPASRANAVWYINAACEDQLRLMKDDAGNFIYLAPGSQMNQSPYGLLLGRPVIPLIGSMPALGDEGDVIFADLSYYYAIVKTGGLKQAISSHLYFDRDIQAYKFTMRIDGSCPFKSPVVTEFGNYSMSAFITLADRA